MDGQQKLGVQFVTQFAEPKEIREEVYHGTLRRLVRLTFRPGEHPCPQSWLYSAILWRSRWRRQMLGDLTAGANAELVEDLVQMELYGLCA